jgi:SAM-dependent methyltransferase
MSQQFMNILETSWNSNTFVKLSLSKYSGNEDQLKNIYIKRTTIKKEDKLSFTYHHQTKDIVKNYSFDEGIFLVNKYLDPQEFHIANLFTLTADYNLEYKAAHWNMKTLHATFTVLPAPDHDKHKKRILEATNKTYLHALKITDLQGKVFPHAQDKYKQINHYIEILSTLLNDLPPEEEIRVVDMGSGKGYLTFALYDYLRNILQRTAAIHGVEIRKDLVDLCNHIAKQSHLNDLHFVVGTIDSYDNKDFNVLIALHACDTATDDAICKGILANAKLIVVAPCCHKQIRKEMNSYKSKTPLDDIIRHGIYLERQAEMITDSIRALIFEYYGYSVKVFDFISDAHTPKNIMITAQKKTRSATDRQEILHRIQHLKSIFGIKSHYLQKQLNLE